MQLLLSLFLLPILLFGVELELDKNYSGPKKLTVMQLGVSMGLPHQWEAVAKKSKGLLLFQQATKDTMRLRAKRMNASEAITYLNKPHYLNESTKLFPQGRIVKIGMHIYSRSYATAGGQDNRAHLVYVVLGPQERAVVMNVRYDKANDSAVKATAMNIVQTLTFTPTKQLQNALQDLEMRLSGAHFAYMQRDGAYEEKRELWLCSNGRYLLHEDRTVAGGLSRVKEQKLGQWSVEDETLILQGDDGFDRLINIKRQDNALFFDGQRSYELKNSQCK